MLASGKAIARTLFRVGLLPLVGVSKCLSIAFPGPLAPPDFLYGKSATGDPGCGGGDRVPGGPLTNRRRPHAPPTLLTLARSISPLNCSAHTDSTALDAAATTPEESASTCTELGRLLARVDRTFSNCRGAA